MFGSNNIVTTVFGSNSKVTTVFSCDNKVTTVFGSNNKVKTVFGCDNRVTTVFGRDRISAGCVRSPSCSCCSPHHLLHHHHHLHCHWFVYRKSCGSSRHPLLLPPCCCCAPLLSPHPLRLWPACYGRWRRPGLGSGFRGQASLWWTADAGFRFRRPARFLRSQLLLRSSRGRCQHFGDGEAVVQRCGG